jgi:hypothetical protein
MRQTSVVKGEYASALVGNAKFKTFDGTSNAPGEMTCHGCSTWIWTHCTLLWLETQFLIAMQVFVG